LGSLHSFLIYFDQINIISWFQKRQREALRDLVLHQTVNAVVEIAKENYLASVEITIQFSHLLVKHFDTYFFTELLVCDVGCIYS
jgi:hypothetical protein